MVAVGQLKDVHQVEARLDNGEGVEDSEVDVVNRLLGVGGGLGLREGAEAEEFVVLEA